MFGTSDEERIEPRERERSLIEALIELLIVHLGEFLKDLEL
jgi:hypothetical protein